MAALSLISMKLSPEEKKELTEVEYTPPEYPWGLELSLDNEQIEKLKLDTLPSVGAEMGLIAVAKVVSISEHESENHSSRGLRLQITDMNIKASPTSDTDRAEKMFGGSNES